MMNMAIEHWKTGGNVINHTFALTTLPLSCSGGMLKLKKIHYQVNVLETLFQVCLSKYCSASQKVVTKLVVDSYKVVSNIQWLTFDYRSSIIQLKLTFLLTSMLGTNSNLQTVLTIRVILCHLWPSHSLRLFWKLIRLIQRHIALVNPLRVPEWHQD